MIIDAHTHLFTSATGDSSRDLLRAMDRAGIAKAALFPSPGKFVSTAQVAAVAARQPDRFFAIGSGNPLEDVGLQIAELRRFASAGAIRGIKFFTGYEHFSPGDVDALRPFLDLALEHDLPVIFHTGDTFAWAKSARLKFAQPLAVDEVAVAYPELTVIIAHCGYPWIEDAAAVIYKNANVYADISGWAYAELAPEDAESLTRRLLTMREYLGSLDKLLFGTDYPIMNPESYVHFASALPIPDDEREKILSGNALRIFKLG